MVQRKGNQQQQQQQRPPSYPQHHHDGKNRGADLKKKMKKKSRSIKRSDLESLRSSPPPPPTSREEKATSPLHVKQSPTKSTQASPNYMKSTSSFDARKEHSPVSSRISQTSLVNNKTPTPNNSHKSKNSSVSSHKPSRTLLTTRTSSLKLMVRTLTKTPNFKPSRASKKCSTVVLCEEDLVVQRATCSSTLKHSKFPNYLALNPGGTELEGTSVMKVCPYTYCSLNGHHHAPLPPLRSFLSAARRRMLKTQKSIKLGCSSPRPTKRIDAGQVIFAEVPAIQEKCEDFFVEIYSKQREASADTRGRSKQDVDDKDLALPGPETEIDFDLFNQKSNVVSLDKDMTGFFPDDRMAEVAEDIYRPPSAQEESTGPPIILLDEQDLCLDDVPTLKSHEIDDCINQEERIFKLVDTANRFLEEILYEEELQELYDEESVSSEAWLEDGDSDLDGSYQNMESDKPSVVSNNQSHDQLSPTMEETDGNTILDDTLGTERPLDPIEDIIEGPTATNEDINAVSEPNNEIPCMGLQLGDHEIKCTSNHHEKGSPHDNYACRLLLNQGSDSSHYFTEHYQGKTGEDSTASNKSIQVFKSDAVTENQPVNEVFDRSFLPNTKDSEIDHDCVVQNLSIVDASDEMETEQVDAAKSVVRIEPSDLSEEFSEADRDTTKEDGEESKLAAIAEFSAMNQTFSNERLSAKTEDDSSDKQAKSNCVVKNQYNPKRGLDESEASNLLNYIHSENHKHTGKVGLQQADDKMEVECESKSDEEKLCSTVQTTPSTETKNLLHIPSTSNEELCNTCNNLKGTIRRKRAVEELEGISEFHPREPNYLPVEPDPEGERVDLRHQMMDERKNAEEWMVDFALRQAVTRLAPARRRKVALLVEAFEKVMPLPKYDTHLRNTSEAFPHARPMQACS